MSDYNPAFPKPKRLNKRGHEWGCKCRSCIGSRNRRNGLDAQRKAAKEAGVVSHRHGDMGNEETFTRTGLAAFFAIEVKSGVQVPKFIPSAFAQAAAAKAIGDPRATACVVVPKDSQDPLFVCRVADLVDAFDSQGPTNSYNIRSLARKLESLAKEIGGLAS